MPAIPPSPEDQPDTSPTWGDYGRAALHGAQGVAGGISAATRYLHEIAGTEDYGLHAAEEQEMGRAQERTLEAMSPTAQKRLQASLTSGEFWSHPFSGVALKSADMAAPLLATALPAGIATGAIGAGLAAAGTGGLIGTGQMLQEFDKRIDSASDEELQKDSQLYRGIRTRLDEPEAREQFRKDILGAKPALTFLFNAAANAFGPAAQVAKAVRGIPGLTGRIGTEAATGAVGGAVQGGATELGTQSALVAGQLQPSIDSDKLTTAILDPAAFGGILGAGVGAVSRGKSNTAEPATKGVSKPIPTEEGQKAPEAVDGQPTKQGRTGAEAPPAEDTPVGEEITHTELTPEQKGKEAKKQTVGDKLKADNKKKREATIAGKETQPLDPAHTEALKAQEGTPGPDPKEIAAAAATQVHQALPSQQVAPAVEHLSPDAAPEPPAQPAVEHITNPEAKPAVEHLVNQDNPVAAQPGAATEANAGSPDSPQRPRIAPGSDEELGVIRQALHQSAKRPIVETPMPSGMNSSRDPSGPIYVDPSVPKELRKFGAVHETVEDHLMEQGYKYPEAHKVATKVELAAVDAAGLDVKKYNADWEEALAKTEKQKVPQDQLPKDTHVDPYLADQDANVGEGARAAEPVTSQVKISESKKPRVLEDTSKEAKANIKAQDKQLDKNIKAATAEPTEEVAPSHKSKEVQVAKAKAAQTAEEITTKHAPVEGEDSAATLARAEQMSSAARAVGVTIPKVLRGDVHPSVAILNEAQRLAKKNETKRSPKELEAHVTTFRVREAALREGDVKAVKAERAIEAEAIKRKDQSAEGEPSAAKVQGTESEGAASEVRKIPVSEDLKKKYAAQIAALGEKEKKREPLFEKAPEKRFAPEELSKEVEDELNKGIQRELDRTRRVREAQDRKPAPKGWERAETTPGEHINPREAIKSSYTEEVNGEDGSVHSLSTTTVKDLYDRLLTLGVGSSRQSPFKQFIDKRVRSLTGAVKLHIVALDDIKNVLAPSEAAARRGDTPRAYYDLREHHIVMAAEHLANPHVAMNTLIHEGIHAFTSRTLERDPKFAKAVSLLLNRALQEKNHIEIKTGKKYYGLTNEHEFVAELFSNPKFQEFLGGIDLHPNVKTEIERTFGKLDGRLTTLWDTFLGLLRKAMGLKPHEHTMLEAALQIGAHLEAEHLHAQERAFGEVKPGQTALFAAPEVATGRLERSLLDNAHETVTGLMRRPELQVQRSKPWLLALRTLDQIAQIAENYFQSSAVRTISDTVERMRIGAEKKLNATAPLIGKLYQLEQKYKAELDATGKNTWQRFAEFAHKATVAQVHPDVELTHAKNKHLQHAQGGVEHLDSGWSRAQHPELAKAYKALPADLKAAYHEATEYFSNAQNEMSLGIINNRVLKALGHDDASLGRRIFERNTTDADLDTLGKGNADKGKDLLKVIQDARELAKIEGPYIPLMRRGDYVVSAHVPVEAPKNAKAVSEREFDFSDRDEAVKWARSQEARTSLQSVWADKDTGSTHVVDPEDGTERRITAKDVDAEQRWRASVNNRHVEFHESEKDALRSAALLEKELGKENVKGVQRKRYESVRDANITSSQMRTLLNSLSQRSGWDKMSAREKHAIEEALKEASIRFMGSTRIQSKRLPRTNVAGYSEDLTRNMHEYAVSASSHLARLEHAPVLEKAMSEMREQAENDYSKDQSLSRTTIANAVEKHLDRPLFEENKKWHAWTKRLMTASFLDKLFGPSQNIINSLQPTMVSMPVLGARHGYGRSFSEMRRAYSDIGGLGIVRKGLKDTLAKTRSSTADTGHLMDDIVARAAKTDDERAMFKHLMEVGSIQPESGMEISQLVKAHKGIGGKLDVGLGYLESIARQMPRSIEAMNRSATALAAYRLELGRGASHEAATRYAQEAVNNTQFLYSATNRPALFNHPLARLSLQFKQYGQGMYHLIGMNIGKALEGQSPEMRREALKTLAGIAATHVAFAGVLGLPTEPFKYLLMGAQGLGVSPIGWGDVENQGRKIAAGLFGKSAGEAVMSGLPRLLGIDLSSRVGMSSLMTFGEPRLSSPNAEDAVWAYIGKSIAGAPASLIGDWVKGANELVSGNFEKAGELMIPVKFIADSLRAYRQATEGKKSATGRETMSPYTPAEAVTRALGFTPAREAETGARSGAFYSQQKRSQAERSKLTNDWVNAKPAEKGAAFKAVQIYNKGKDPSQQIKPSELTAAARRRETEKKSTIDGIKTDKRTKKLLEDSPYNVQ